MVRDIGRLIRQSGIFGVGIVLSKAVGFFMIPVYTRYLTPSDYGVLELLDLILFLATNIAAMGLFSAVFRFYATADTEKEKKEVVATALIFSAVSFLVGAALMIVAANWVSRLAFGSAHFAHLVRIVALTFFFSNLAEVPMAYIRAKEKVVLFVTIGLARTVLGVLTMVFFLIVLRWGVEGVVYGGLLTNGIGGVALSGAVLALVPKKLSGPKLKEMLAFGLPLVPWSINMFILTFSDRFFLRHFGTLADVGIYALAYKLAMIIPFLVNVPFNLVWQWQQFEFAKRDDAKELYAKVTTYLLLAAAFVGLGIAVMARDALRIMTPPSYWAAAHIVPLIILSYVFSALGLVVVSGIYVQKVTRRLVPIAMASALATLALNWLLIPRYLAIGAAIATVLSYALNLVLSYWQSQKFYFVRYHYVRNAATLGLAVGIYLLSILPRLELKASIALNLLLVLIFVGLALGLLGREERGTVQQLALAATGSLRRGLFRVTYDSRLQQQTSVPDRKVDE
jgi:O-antigen/teichoic acid export membrane protein